MTIEELRHIIGQGEGVTNEFKDSRGGLPVDCTEHLMAAMGEMELPVGLQDAAFEEVLLDLVPSWVEKGTQLP